MSQQARLQAEQWLRETLGAEATFRKGQWEAIESVTVKHQRVLVVQRTGWGKSLVYFMATRLLRAQGAGVTILISPLLSLMRNQIESATAWGLKAASINSTNSDQHTAIEDAVLRDEVDLLLISPERLANDRFQTKMWGHLRESIGLMVVDEAHCISDWGHDFRPNYRRIMHLLDELPSHTPVIGTTATANDRVVADVAEILGTGIEIQRGTLTRDSLALYVYPEPMDAATRLTLLSHLLESIPGSGIIYCTTTRDCRIVADWLRDDGFNVKAYYADVESVEGEDRIALEQQLMNNQVKALVSSVALGMGFDKSDLHFVIHYQLPGNIIGYYQQIGRAGRGIDRAHIILMHGPGDEDIQRFFIDTAFPKPEQVTAVINALQENSLSRNQLQQAVNARWSVLEKILVHLEVEEIIEKQGRNYTLRQANTQPDYERWSTVTATRYVELRHMQDYTHEKACLMHYIATALDDPKPPERCGRCKNCTGAESKFQPNSHAVLRAQRFLREGKPLTLEPRKRWPGGMPHVSKTTDICVNQTGLALCMIYDNAYGEQVRLTRTGNGLYNDDLVDACVAALRTYLPNVSQHPDIIVPVPSLRRPTLVPDFTQRLAKHIGLPVVHALEHRVQHPPQADMHNSYQQAFNLLDRFTVANPLAGESILLVDDVADSRWTLTVLGDLLQRHGAGIVYPFAIATTNTSA